MANAAAGAGRFVLKHGPRLAMKYGPSLMKAVGNVREYVNDHPTIPAWVQERLDNVVRQVDSVRKRRGDAAQISGLLEVLREQMVSLDGAVDLSQWTDHAHNIERRVRVAEKLSQPLRDQKLAELRAETETLLAGFIDAIAYVPPGASA